MRNLTKLWRPCDGNNLPVMRLEPMSQPNSDSFSDHLQTFCERVYREIKRKLYSGRREDPEVRIEIQVDDDVLNESLGRITQTFQPSRFDRESPDLMCCLPLSRFLSGSPDLS